MDLSLEKEEHTIIPINQLDINKFASMVIEEFNIIENKILIKKRNRTFVLNYEDLFPLFFEVEFLHCNKESFCQVIISINIIQNYTHEVITRVTLDENEKFGEYTTNEIDLFIVKLNNKIENSFKEILYKSDNNLIK